jgi:hypothetical protein
MIHKRPQGAQYEQTADGPNRQASHRSKVHFAQTRRFHGQNPFTKSGKTQRMQIAVEASSRRMV